MNQLAAFSMSHMRQTCKVCLRPDKFNFHVPDEIWYQVVPEQYQNKVVCLACFDDFARAKAIDYARHIDSVYFAGDCAAFSLRVVSATAI